MILAFGRSEAVEVECRFEVFTIGLQEDSSRKSFVVKTKEEDGGSCGVARQPVVNTPNHWHDKRDR